MNLIITYYCLRPSFLPQRLLSPPPEIWLKKKKRQKIAEQQILPLKRISGRQPEAESIYH